MRIQSYRVRNYRSTEDSGQVEIDPGITCLVGKNESGKTSLLKALAQGYPLDPTGYDITNDYPRTRLRKYERTVEATKKHDAVLEVSFLVEALDAKAVAERCGACVKEGAIAKFTKRYGDGGSVISLPVDESAFVSHVLAKHDLPGSFTAEHPKLETIAAVQKALAAVASPEPALQKLKAEIETIKGGLEAHVWNSILKPLCPKILYFDNYRIMRGKAKPEQLANPGDDEGLQTLSELLALAGITADKLVDASNYEHHKAHLESIANEITDDVFRYWRQNANLEVQFDVSPSKEIHVRIYNQKHRVSVTFDERSRGFVWFFSFLVAFKRVSETNNRLVILLDEPGLNLHASAQEDLLVFMQEQLADEGHQVIYTTHSPFMIDPDRLERVRTVEDVDGKGTTVTADCLTTDKATVFPLQAALGYSLAQTLFLGPNCLLVEGPTELL